MTTTTIEMYEPPRSVDICNDDRAEMVRPLVRAFHDAYYWHEDGEPLATVIGDMIADMLHLVDRLDASEWDSVDPDTSVVLAQAEGHYEAEVEEAALFAADIAAEEDHGAPTDT